MQKQTKNFLVGIIAIIIITATIVVIATSSSKQSASTPDVVSKQEVSQGQPSIERNGFEIIGQQTDPYWVVNILIKPGDTKVQSYAQDVKAKCKQPCNVIVFDDRSAYDLQSEYDQFSSEVTTDQTKIQLKAQNIKEWQSKNYVFVADHTVGMIDVSTNEYQAYPFKDSTYNQFKK